jgi:hypothetical protein
MVTVVQGLGRLDITLIDADQVFISDFERNINSLPESTKLTEQFTLSYLWVLGAYELVRSICQRIKEKNGTIPDELKGFAELKKEFNRLRVPLAKMEPASSHKNTDSHIAYPALNTKKGIAWQIAHDVFITRQDLADRLLATLELAVNKDSKHTNPGSTST